MKIIEKYTKNSTTWEISSGSRVVIATKDRESNYYYSRLYVDNGNIATTQSRKAKTQKGMLGQARRMLGL